MTEKKAEKNSGRAWLIFQIEVTHLITAALVVSQESNLPSLVSTRRAPPSASIPMFIAFDTANIMGCVRSLFAQFASVVIFFQKNRRLTLWGQPITWRTLAL